MDIYNWDMSIYAGSSQGFSERLDCCVRALAVAGCIEYAESHALFERHGRRDRCRTPLRIIRAAIAELFPKACGYAIPGRGESLARFLQMHRKGHYFIMTVDHAFALCDGVVHDWKLRSRCRVRAYWKLDV